MEWGGGRGGERPRCWRRGDSHACVCCVCVGVFVTDLSLCKTIHSVMLAPRVRRGLPRQVHLPMTTQSSPAAASSRNCGAPACARQRCTLRSAASSLERSYSRTIMCVYTYTHVHTHTTHTHRHTPARTQRRRRASANQLRDAGRPQYRSTQASISLLTRSLLRAPEVGTPRRHACI